MIRCSNCGWEGNPDGLAKCQKCNQPLPLPLSGNNSYSNENSIIENSDVRKTVVEVAAIKNESKVFCVGCNQPLHKDALFCHHCGTKVGDENMPHNGHDMNETVSLNKTVLMSDVPSSIKENKVKEINTKATVPDIDVVMRGMGHDMKLVDDGDNEKNVGEKEKISVFSYTLVTNDVFTTVEGKLENRPVVEDSFEIKIDSPIDLMLGKGDILLIGGLRFLMK